ncbi:hypothetical protein [Nitrosomonas nitrosa]|uniref:hypothetical protein n=1 Tax=Nitrosomonas nitrosa TaxID=52442 RepID=UPI0015E665F7|nr:hypothetical protein [Nitrosomonas nitrosa]
MIKLLFAKGLLKQERLSAARQLRKERGIWLVAIWNIRLAPNTAKFTPGIGEHFYGERT